MRTLDPRKWGFEMPPWWRYPTSRRVSQFQDGIRKLYAFSIRGAGYEDEVKPARGAFDLIVRRFGRDGPVAADGMEDLGDHLYAAGQFDEAISLFREALSSRTQGIGPNHPKTVRTELRLANSLLSAGKNEEAISALFHVVEVRKEGIRPESVETLDMLVSLGMTLSRFGVHDVAQHVLREAIAGWRRYAGPKDRRTLTATSWYALVLTRQENFGSALRLRRRLLDDFARTFGPRDPDTLRAMWNLANLLHLAGRDDEARVLLNAVIDWKVRLQRDGDDETKKMRQLLDEIDGAPVADAPGN